MITEHTHKPLSFLEWKAYYEDSFDATELPKLYNSYLQDWKTEKLDKENKKNEYTRLIYTEFLKNVNLSTIDNKITTFLDRIDDHNIYELELAVHYYCDIIKEQLKTVRSLREEVKFSKTKNKLKSSKYGVSSYLKNFIVKLLSNKEFVQEETKTLHSEINLPKIANNISINLNTYASDDFVINYKEVDKNLVLNLNQKVLDEVPNIIQVLSVNTDTGPKKIRINNISAPNRIVGINQPFTDWRRLPSRYFAREQKNLKHLKFTLEKNIIEKYIANNLYYVNNDQVSKVFTPENPTNNLAQRYGPNDFNNLINIKHNEIFPYQLSFYNTGVTVFYSKDLSYVENLTAYKGEEYIIPDPNKYEAGVKCVGVVKNNKTGEIIKNIFRKRKPPFNYTAKNLSFKNDNLKPGVNNCDNKVNKSYGYQSKENSIDYSFTGINKKEDAISFWEDDATHVNWKNTDTYPIGDLNVYPETERLDDLLIYNKTGVKLKSDIYGNEFFFVKSLIPKRKADNAHVSNRFGDITTNTTSITCITAAEYYDGLYFDSMLSAISAAEYKVNGTLYSSVTGIYDTFIYSEPNVTTNTTKCTGASADGFRAPLTEFTPTTIFTNALSCGSVSAISAIDCGSFKNHPGTGTQLISAVFQETTIPYYSIDTTAIYSTNTTVFESTSLNEFVNSRVYLFDQAYVNAGEVYVRNVGTQLISPLSTAFANVFNKHSSRVKSNILTTSNIVDFDIVEDTIWVQTSAETVSERYKYEGKEFKIATSSKTLVLSA